LLKGVFESFERFLGRGSASVTMPPMDGALKPNSRLDGARSTALVPAPDNLMAVGSDVLFTSERKLLRVRPGEWGRPATVVEFDHPILSAAASPDGAIAVGLDGAGIRIVGGTRDGKSIAPDSSVALGCPVALAFRGNDTLIVCEGSSVNKAADWQRDLMEMECAGSVWSVDLVSGKWLLLADRLSFPYGILILPGGGEALISESWKSRIVKIGLSAKATPKIVLADLPGYPARLSNRAGGGAWLSVFAPRSQLIEFVMREKAYRRAMMAEVDPEFWIAPALASGKSFSEPMQGGALKQMGILKPWAPTRSYGLAIALDERFEPRASLHSRAGGERHGITSCEEVAGELMMTSKGGNEIIAVGLDGGGE
jgi:hypothetical protein